mgnify:CR=1 FL=1
MIRPVGPCVIASNSGLRKRMRAARRGLLPAEDLQKIELATSQKALMRHKWYRKKMAALLGELSA